jgi:hypothetical protein
MKAFTPDSQSVCRIPDGNTNDYLTKSRAIEDFLKKVEPKYNQSVAMITGGNIDQETIFVLAGFISYVITCSPGGMRIHSEPFCKMVTETVRQLDKRGNLRTPPTELGGETLTDLLDSNRVQIEVDPRYPQAVGITSINELTNAFGNFTWEILVNDRKDIPFFTSDFPVAIEHTTDPRVINRLVPLSPTLAVRILPDFSYNGVSKDFSFPRFRRVLRRPPRAEVARINRLLVQCAESLVFFRDNHKWVEPFVRTNAGYRIEPYTDRFSFGTGSLLVNSLRIVPYQSTTSN